MSRASTWTCLLSPETRYHYGGQGQQPDWVRELPQVTGGEPTTVNVVFGQAAVDPISLRDLAGVVGVNCSNVGPSAWRDAGFSYVREFAVVPSLGDPRLFIPLDSAAVAGGAFALYAPLKFAARCKFAVARAAARLGVAAWYRDRVTIALRHPSPLEQRLAALFGGEEIRLALASGSAPPALNRKITVGVLSQRGELLAFAKLPGPLALSQRGIENSARVLTALAARPAPLYAPRLLFTGTVCGAFIEVTSPLRGRVSGTAFTHAHERFLNSLRSGRSRPVAETEWALSLFRLRPLLARHDDLDRVLEQLLPTIQKTVLPTAIVHGDFAPWNLRLDAGHIYAFDWETGSLEGPPLIDHTHFLLSVGYLVHRWTVKEAVARMLDVARSAPQGLNPQTALALQTIYLLDYLVRRLEEGYDEHDARIAWCRQLTIDLAALISTGPN